MMIVKYSLLILLILTFNSCMKVDCDRLAEAMRKDDFLIVVYDMPNTGSYRFDVSGINPVTGKKKNVNQAMDGTNIIIAFP
ncbi:hypothetical protein LNQ49_16745 [Flavobacterium sp. F-65]|uniref:Uncharacterized protein n=1 Tax=Flavobacterium pisciphilum TaxID=2893755 RepID=A0ABS8MWS4_9FLAO|nr:hypothetical protein [Flavobacterium sp. F-65]MCC9073227.1 hypothetical protein [Flavobacterium sp. F-65]